MIRSVLNEAERYDFPIIIERDGDTVRNSTAKRVRSFSRFSPLSQLGKRSRERVSLLSEGSAVAIKTKRGTALVLRRINCLVFMYLPMLENAAKLPSEEFFLDASARDLPELLSNLAKHLYLKREINASSFARISSVTSTLCFSEDVVKTELNSDGSVDVERAFYALGRALSELDFKDATELSDPPVTISFSGDTLTVSLYGEVLCVERPRALTAVLPYSFTEREYFASFVLAVAAAIFKSRK